MKYTFKQSTISFFTLVMALLFTAYGCSKKMLASGGIEQVTMAIDSSRWTFTPTQVFPQNGRSQQVNGSNYSATLKEGKFNVYLPYYGRAYAGIEMLAGRSPLYFTSADFSIEKEVNATGKWNLVVKPRDYDKVQSMNFTFFNNGTANVDVILTNRSAISFSGLVGPVN